MMKLNHDDGFLFSGSSAEATFSDGTTVALGSNITLYSGTPLGDEIWLSSPDNSHVVRLILIVPEQDWRRNQTYAWKLDSAWMSDPVNDGWLHWNVQSYIESAVRAPLPNNVFHCELLELHFRPILGSGYNEPVISNTRLVLRNVQIGAHLPTNTSQIAYWPCSKQDCSIVDGKVTGGISSDRIPQSFRAISAIIGVLLLVVAVSCVHWYRRRQRSKLYQQLSPGPEEDLVLHVEAIDESSRPQSSGEDVTNTTG